MRTRKTELLCAQLSEISVVNFNALAPQLSIFYLFSSKKLDFSVWHPIAKDGDQPDDWSPRASTTGVRWGRTRPWNQVEPKFKLALTGSWFPWHIVFAWDIPGLWNTKIFCEKQKDLPHWSKKRNDIINHLSENQTISCWRRIIFFAEWKTCFCHWSILSAVRQPLC